MERRIGEHVPIVLFVVWCNVWLTKATAEGCKHIPKPVSQAECDCSNNGTDVTLTCYSEVDCWRSESPFDHEIEWYVYIQDDKGFPLISDSRYHQRTTMEILGQNIGSTQDVRFKATLAISNVSDIDYRRMFKCNVFSDYQNQEILQLPLMPICNQTTEQIFHPVPPTIGPVLLGFLVLLFVCIVHVLVMVFLVLISNLPLKKYLLATYWRKDMLYTRKHLQYDTVLMYDSHDHKAKHIAASLKDQLTSRGYDVASEADILGGEHHLQGLEKLSTSATVIFIVTPDACTDFLLLTMRDVSACHNSPEEQILVYTGEVPSIFLQKKLLKVRWSDACEQSTTCEQSVDGSNDNVESTSSRRHKKDNVVSRMHRNWIRCQFYCSLQLGLSRGFGVGVGTEASRLLCQQSTGSENSNSVV